MTSPQPVIRFHKGWYLAGHADNADGQTLFYTLLYLPDIQKMIGVRESIIQPMTQEWVGEKQEESDPFLSWTDDI